MHGRLVTSCAFNVARREAGKELRGPLGGALDAVPV
jgi:hypothetical protein